VGDPFKDTAGPSLHILVKLLSTITLVNRPPAHLRKRIGGIDLNLPSETGAKH
jgi:hypothetical protein